MNSAAHFISSTQCGTAGPPNNVYWLGPSRYLRRCPRTGSAAVSPCMQPVEFGINFDDVTPPTLPPGWMATNAQGPPPLWVTSNSGLPSPPADTPPNAAFIDDPAVISDKRLNTTGSLTVFEATSPRLTFRHNFNLEASDEDPSLGFDGGVLEISIDQGQTFHDILDAGGSFVVGGYNRTISSDRGSPIAGRRAWSGNSGGFITTTVALPPIIIEGKLRWRMASDNSGSSEGWRVDTIDISWCQGPPCSPTPTAPPSATPTATATVTPTATPSATATATSYGYSYDYTYRYYPQRLLRLRPDQHLLRGLT